MNKKAPPISKFVLRIPSALHATLTKLSKKQGVSLNHICLELIHLGIENNLVEKDLFRKIINLANKRFDKDFIGLILFGSVARGEQSENSDVDLLIVLNSSVVIKRELYRDWDDLLPEKISIHFSHLPNMGERIGSLWLESALDGKIIYQKNKELSEILNQIKEYITSGKALRKTTHGQGYWIHV